jgi:Fe-S cluster assembly protein SufD
LADQPSWATEVREAAAASLSSLPELTGEEEAWRFTPPTDLGLAGSEPSAPGASTLPGIARGARAAQLELVDGAPSAPTLGELPDGVIVAEL